MSKFVLTEKQTLIEGVLLSLVNQYGPFGAVEEVKNALKNGKSDSLKGNDLDQLKKAGVTVDNVLELVKIYANNRQLMQKIMIEMLEKDPTLAVEGSKDAVIAILDLEKLPEDAKNTLQEALFDSHINALTTDFVFTPMRLDAATALIKNGFAPAIAFKVIDHTRGEYIQLIPQSLNHIKDIISNLILTIVTEQVVPIEDVVDDIREMLINKKESKYAFKYEYGSVLLALQEFVDAKIKGITPAELILSLITGPMKIEIEKDAIRSKETFADNLLMRGLVPHFKLPAGLVPDKIELVDSTKMIQQKMYRIKTGYFDPWALNNNNFTMPAPVCPPVQACSAAIATNAAVSTVNAQGYNAQQLGTAIVASAVITQLCKPVFTSLYRKLNSMFFAAKNDKDHDLESNRYSKVSSARKL